MKSIQSVGDGWVENSRISDENEGTCSVKIIQNESFLGEIYYDERNSLFTLVQGVVIPKKITSEHNYSNNVVFFHRFGMYKRETTDAYNAINGLELRLSRAHFFSEDATSEVFELSKDCCFITEKKITDTYVAEILFDERKHNELVVVQAVVLSRKIKRDYSIRDLAYFSKTEFIGPSAKADAALHGLTIRKQIEESYFLKSSHFSTGVSPVECVRELTARTVEDLRNEEPRANPSMPSVLVRN